MFVTAEVHARTRFARAVQTRNLVLAESALGELPWVRLDDALALLALYGEAHDAKFDRAAVRWLGRLYLEKRSLSFALAFRCAELVGELRGPDAHRAAVALESLVRG